MAPPRRRGIRRVLPIWQRVVLTLGLMSGAVYVLNLAGPSSSSQQRKYHEQVHQVQQETASSASSLTEGFNASGIPCITYWTLGCPSLKGPYIPKQDTSVASSSATATTQSPKVRIGLLRPILNPLPGYATAHDILHNLQVILQTESTWFVIFAP